MSQVICPEPGSQLTVGSVPFGPAYVPVLERNHNPTAHDEMMRLLDECARLGKENAALRSLLREWYELFAPVRREGTEGARLLDRTAEAMASEFRYKTPNAEITGGPLSARPVDCRVSRRAATTDF